jgi:hypothetical protein
MRYLLSDPDAAYDQRRADEDEAKRNPQPRLEAVPYTEMEKELYAKARRKFLGW